MSRGAGGGLIRPAALAALLALAALPACQTVSPTAGASVGPGGPNAAVGARSGRVSGGVDTDGDVGVAADVVSTPNARVRVGTGGPSASVRVGGGPVRVGIGRHGPRIGI